MSADPSTVKGILKEMDIKVANHPDYLGDFPLALSLQ